MTLLDMPLFPLNTVLFPGGVLPLRIFEPRYVSMVGERMRSGQPFAVVLIQEGHETGQVTDFYAVGTSAQIVDFDQLEDGMLGITCVGTELVRVQRYRAQPDQLLIGQVEVLAADAYEKDQDRELNTENMLPMPAEHAPLIAFLRRVLESEQAQAYRKWLSEDWSNATWIGYRLAELLPLTTESKQTLLEMDSLQRLQIVHGVMQENELL